MKKLKNIIVWRKLPDILFVKVSGLYDIPYSSYPSKCSTQINRAHYGNTMLVPKQMGTNMAAGINENIWSSLLLEKAVRSLSWTSKHSHEHFLQNLKTTGWGIFLKHTWQTSGGHLDVVWCEILKFKMVYLKDGGCYWAKNLQQDIY